MKIHVNGETLETTHTNLAALLVELGHDAEKVATAVDGLFVARTARANTVLTETSAIDIVAPMEGG